MTFALRRTVWLDGERRPDDYEVRHNGRTVGRHLSPTEYRLGGTDSLDAVRTAFRAAWQRPLSEEGADVICSA